MNTTSSPHQKPAGLPRQIGAILYDALLLFGVLFVVTAPVVILLEWTYQDPGYTIYIISMIFFYFGWFWTHGGQTLGMKTWKIRLVSTENSKVRWPQAFRRFVTAWVSCLAAGTGFFRALFSKDGATWHDLASNTRLVRVD